MSRNYRDYRNYFEVDFDYTRPKRLNRLMPGQLFVFPNSKPGNLYIMNEDLYSYCCLNTGISYEYDYDKDKIVFLVTWVKFCN